MNSDEFLLDTLNEYFELDVPSLNKEEKINLRRNLFSMDDFMNLKLKDRFLLLRDKIKDAVIETFLVHLYNKECDTRWMKYTSFSFQNHFGSFELMCEKVIESASYYRDRLLDVIIYFVKQIEFLFIVGYEPFIFNIIDEFLFYFDSNGPRQTIESVMKYYNRNSMVIGGSKEYERFLCGVIRNLFNDTIIGSIKRKLLLKMFSRQITVVKRLPYCAYVDDKNIYVLDGAVNCPIIMERVLLHESMHLLHNFESRYTDFYQSHIRYFNPEDLDISWTQSKERIIDQTLTIHGCHTVNELKTSDLTMQIVPTALLNLKKKQRVLTHERNV